MTQDSYRPAARQRRPCQPPVSLDGIIIPESIAGFGQTVSTRFADQLNFLDGALPAQYGYRTAGIVDITTKGGALDQGVTHRLLRRQSQYQQCVCRHRRCRRESHLLCHRLLDGKQSRNRGADERPATPSTTIRRRRTVSATFPYAFDADTRLSLVAGAANNNFQIPNIPGKRRNTRSKAPPIFPHPTQPESDRKDAPRRARPARARRRFDRLPGGCVLPLFERSLSSRPRRRPHLYRRRRSNLSAEFAVRSAGRFQLQGRQAEHGSRGVLSTVARGFPPTIRRKYFPPMPTATRRAPFRTRSSTTQRVSAGNSASTCRTSGNRPTPSPSISAFAMTR